MKKFTTTFLLTLLSISPVTAQTKPDVAVLGADPNNLSDPRSKLESTGLFNNVDAINISSTTPSLSNLQQYDAVLVYYSDFPADRNALGDVLADYVDRGGPMQGRSMVPLLTGASDTIRQPGATWVGNTGRSVAQNPALLAERVQALLRKSWKS